MPDVILQGGLLTGALSVIVACVPLALTNMFGRRLRLQQQEADLAAKRLEALQKSVEIAKVLKEHFAIDIPLRTVGDQLLKIMLSTDPEAVALKILEEWKVLPRNRWYRMINLPIPRFAQPEATAKFVLLCRRIATWSAYVGSVILYLVGMGYFYRNDLPLALRQAATSWQVLAQVIFLLVASFSLAWSGAYQARKSSCRALRELRKRAGKNKEERMAQFLDPSAAM